MELTDENKKYIDGLSYEWLLRGWRNGILANPKGSSWFQGETGEYWSKCMSDMRAQPGGNSRHVSASKAIGW